MQLDIDVENFLPANGGTDDKPLLRIIRKYLQSGVDKGTHLKEKSDSNEKADKETEVAPDGLGGYYGLSRSPICLRGRNIGVALVVLFFPSIRQRILV